MVPDLAPTRLVFEVLSINEHRPWESSGAVSTWFGTSDGRKQNKDIGIHPLTSRARGQRRNSSILLEQPQGEHGTPLGTPTQNVVTFRKVEFWVILLLHIFLYFSETEHIFL